MSWKKLTLAYVAIVILGLLGVWLGSRALDLGDFRLWAGGVMLIAAAGGLVLIFHRDLRPSEQEKRTQWNLVKAKGKLRYVILQMFRAELVLMPLLAADLYGSYVRAESWNPEWLLTLSALAVAGAAPISVAWWHRQERRYAEAH